MQKSKRDPVTNPKAGDLWKGFMPGAAVPSFLCIATFADGLVKYSYSVSRDLVRAKGNREVCTYEQFVEWAGTAELLLPRALRKKAE